MRPQNMIYPLYSLRRKTTNCGLYIIITELLYRDWVGVWGCKDDKGLPVTLS